MTTKHICRTPDSYSLTHTSLYTHTESDSVRRSVRSKANMAGIAGCIGVLREAMTYLVNKSLDDWTDMIEFAINAVESGEKSNYMTKKQRKR